MSGVFVQVFSSAKYPAPEKLQEYSSIFTGAVDPASQKRPRFKVQSKLRPLDDKALQVNKFSHLCFSSCSCYLSFKFIWLIFCFKKALK